MDGTFTVKSYSSRCRVLIIGAVEEVGQVSTSTCNTLGDALAKFGVTNSFSDARDADGRECQRVREHLEQCPSCSKQHSGDEWYIYTLATSCWSFRNAAFGCQERLLPLLNPYLKNIVDSPKSELDYVQLYLSETDREFRGDGKAIWVFEDGKWKRLNHHQVIAPMQDWFKLLLPRLKDLFCHEQGRQLFVTRSLKDLQKDVLHLRIAEEFISRSDPAKALMKQMLCRVYLKDPDFSDKLDTLPHLLGTRDGTVDLNTGRFRPGHPDDYLTMSVGYDFADPTDPGAAADLDAFMKQVYPVKEERDFMQRYCGYSLTGTHPEKIFMMLTVRPNVLLLCASILHASTWPDAFAGRARRLEWKEHLLESSERQHGGLCLQAGCKRSLQTRQKQGDA